MNANIEKKRQLFKQFNACYFELLNLMKKHGSTSMEFKKFYSYNYFIKKTNVKLFIKTWNETITSLYYDEIMKGNIQYFLEKDYTNDMKGNEGFSQSYNISSYIEYFKNIYNSVEKELISTFVEKIKILTSLSYDYFNLDSIKVI